MAVQFKNLSFDFLNSASLHLMCLSHAYQCEWLCVIFISTLCSACSAAWPWSNTKPLVGTGRISKVLPLFLTQLQRNKTQSLSCASSKMYQVGDLLDQGQYSSWQTAGGSLSYRSAVYLSTVYDGWTERPWCSVSCSRMYAETGNAKKPLLPTLMLAMTLQ